jgi:hypothetical protein
MICPDASAASSSRRISARSPGHDVRLQFSCRCGHDGIHHITGACAAEQSPSEVSPLLGQANHLTPSQEPPELDLRRRAAHLNDNRSGDHWDDSGFQPHSVLGPDAADVTVSSNQDASVINNRRHAERCSGLLIPTRRRAASSSSRVSAPCSASHSATAMRPSELEGMPRRGSHPGRHAHALGLCRSYDPGVDIGINGYGEFGRRVTAWHRTNYTTRVGGSRASVTL